MVGLCSKRRPPSALRGGAVLHVKRWVGIGLTTETPTHGAFFVFFSVSLHLTCPDALAGVVQELRITV